MLFLYPRPPQPETTPSPVITTEDEDNFVEPSRAALSEILEKLYHELMFQVLLPPLRCLFVCVLKLSAFLTINHKTQNLEHRAIAIKYQEQVCVRVCMCVCVYVCVLCCV